MNSAEISVSRAFGLLALDLGLQSLVDAQGACLLLALVGCGRNARLIAGIIFSSRPRLKKMWKACSKSGECSWRVTNTEWSVQ